MTTETKDETALTPARQEAPELTPYEVIERVISSGDLSKMSAADRVAFYWRTCESLDLNPLTRPFEFINLDGKLTMYARKDATDQLRANRRVSVTELRREHDDALGMLTVIAHGRTPDGREEESTGVVFIKGLNGNALANAMMKAETKAKRRLTLSLCGLGFLDETEIEGGRAVDVDPATGIVTEPKPSLLQAVEAQSAALAAAPAEEIPAAAEPEAEAPAEAPFMGAPMTEEQSAAAKPAEPEPPEDEESEAELIADAKGGEVSGLSIAGLAELARAAGKGKMDFAKVIECVPADVGTRIEKMTDEERAGVARALGLTR